MNPSTKQLLNAWVALILAILIGWTASADLETPVLAKYNPYGGHLQYSWFINDTGYLFSNAGFLDFNESRLNKTIVDLDTVWNISTSNWLINNSEILDWNETKGSLTYYIQSAVYNKSEVYNKSGVDNNFVNITGDTMTGNLQIIKNVPDPLSPMINVSNQHTNGTSFIRFENDVGAQVDLGVFGFNVSQALFPTQLEENQSALGLTSRGSPIVIATRDNNSILFGGSPNDNLSDVDFSIKIDTILDAIVFQGNKFIRPAIVEGGFALLFQSFESLPAGGFPYIWVAQDGSDDTIITSWHNNGKNNSYSGQMNSFGAVAKDWITFTGEVTDDVSGAAFLANRSNYVNYCTWLQDNLSLVPEGCKYFADTTGRLVPLLFGGDLEIHRSATIHEGALIYDNFNFVDREDTDADFTWTNTDNGGKLHITDSRTIEANISSFDVVIATFDTTLSPFVSESISPEPGRDWRISIGSPSECFNDECATANGGNEKIIAFSGSTTFQQGTVASSNSKLLFYISTSGAGSLNLSVRIDNNEGNESLVYNQTGIVTNELVNISFPASMENKSNVTTRFSWVATGASPQAWIDQVRITSQPAEPIIINETYPGGKTCWGDDTDPSAVTCIERIKFVNNATQLTEAALNLVGPNLFFNGQSINISGGGGTSDHSALSNLDFPNAGHTGFASSTGDNLTGDYNITGLVTAGEFNGPLNWTLLQNLPSFNCGFPSLMDGWNQAGPSCTSQVTASFVAGGTFGAGDFTFQDDVIINDNLGVGIDPLFEVHVASTVPNWVIEDTNAGANTKVWSINSNSGEFQLETLTDAYGGGQDVIRILRSGTTSTQFRLATTDNLFSGDLTVGSMDFAATTLDVHGSGTFRGDINATGEGFVNGSHKICTSENGLCASVNPGNPFDQSLNTTDNATFNKVTAPKYIINQTANMCIFQNGTDLVISNNLTGVTC